MSRGGAARRPSLPASAISPSAPSSTSSPSSSASSSSSSSSPPSQMEHISSSALPAAVVSTSSHSHSSSAAAAAAATVTAAPPANNNPTASASSPSPAPPIPPFSSHSQPSSPSADHPHPSASSAYHRPHTHFWDPSSNLTGPWTTRSVDGPVQDGSGYPFPPASPSEPSTPLQDPRSREYPTSAASARSALRSPQISQAIGSKLPASASSQHNRRSSHGRSSLGRVKAILKLPFSRRATSPTSSRDRPSSASANPTVPAAPIDRPRPTPTARPSLPPLQPPLPPLLTTSPLSGPAKEGPGMGNSPNEMPESPSNIGLLERRRNRNGPNTNGEPMSPDTLLQNLSQSEKTRAILSPAAPAMLTPPEDDRKQPPTWQPLSSSNPDYANSTSILSEQPLIMTMQSGAGGSNGKGVSAPKLSTPNEPMKSDNILASVLSNGLQAGEEWLGEALKVMLLSHPPDLRPATEAVRLISHALPCPLPVRASADTTSYSAQVDSGYLPESASAAQGVAAAAGYFMLPFTQCKPNNGGFQNSEHDGTTSALNAMTSAIQKVHGDDTRRVYIHVSHAISSNIAAPKIQSSNLTGSSVNSAATSAGSLLPSAFLTSPPHERDFFSSTIFNSVVMAQDPMSYATPSTFPTPILQRPTPNPALPPFSLHFSLLERYIPPPTPTADSAMFSTYSSVLLDRVVELSPNGGSLLFIYPTKTGARQFRDRYLGKVLDPLLRRLMVLHRLRDDLLWGISRMVAVEQMQEFEDLKDRLEHFCRRLSEKSRDEVADEKRYAGPNFFHPNVSLVHAQKVNVALSQFSWREWWTFQESTRIREIVKNHFSVTPSQDGGANQSFIESPISGSEAAAIGQPGLATPIQYSGPMDLAREILDGVKVTTTRPSSRGMGEAVLASSMVGPTPSWPVVGEVGSPTHTRRKPEKETIEIGVFVLRRHG
ncbi:hypothetical protein Dda_7949 [Drechslerella dactyloides]|uniref:Uncharacterized protein n=1 Tax=Drechslerella dactyloides TaxID=74499 RepID=A0AAD6NG33_DREDA|nr:hypothetical protein Dda_7949 [Drechslerella dactyloides]